MPRCAVNICGITSGKANKSGIFVSFHTFPKDPKKRARWLKFCGVVKDPGTSLHICSQHFAPEAFANNASTQQKLTNTGRNILVKDAIPTIRTPEPTEADSSDRSKRYRIKERKEIIDDLLKAHSVDECDVEQLTNVENNISERPLTASEDQTSNETRCDEICDAADAPEEIQVNVETYFPERQLTASGDQTTNEVGNMDVLLEAIELAEPLVLAEQSGGMGSSDDSGWEDFQHHDGFNSTHVQEVEIIVNSELDMLREKLTMKINRLAELSKKRKASIKQLRMQLKDKDRQLSMMTKIIKEKDKKLEESNRDKEILRKACSEIGLEFQQRSDQVIKDQVRKELGKVFTNNQVALILGEKKRVVWTAEEIARAFSLRYHSKPAYEMLRSEYHYPLPCLRSLQEWASCIQMRKGVLEDVLTILKIAGTRLTERERVTVLAYDEMSVESTIELDKRNDDVIGPHSEMQLVMARGLFAQWKQPIFVDFDRKMTIALLEDLASRLYDIGFNVIATVHDCGGGNMGVWKDAGVNHETGQTSMKHPVTGNDIFFFPDAPHLLKLIRNWLLDNGFMYKGTLVTKKFLELLVEKGCTLKRPLTDNNSGPKQTEFNALFKLSLKHITVQGSERQNVRMAAQLLSHTTAVNLRRHFGEYREATLLAEIIETTNAWFDVMNSYNMNQSIPSKKCYGMHLELQNKILNDMETMVKELRVLEKHCLPAASGLKLFQKAILVSITSTKKLLGVVTANPKLDVSFIMTYKINQDCLENEFAMVRLNGGTHDHPSPLQALNRLRLITLGKGLSHQLKKNQNTQQILIEEDHLITKVFRKANVILNKNNVDTVDDVSTSDDEDSEPWVFQKKTRELEEADGFEYAMGYMARSHIKETLGLGSYTYCIEETEEPGINKENYVQDLSYGGLVQPSDQWLDIGDQLDSCFNWMHNTGAEAEEIGFRKKINVFGRTMRKLKQKFPELPDHVLKNYTRKRISIRIRHMQKQVREKKIQKFKNAKKNKFKKNLPPTINESKSAVTRKNMKKLKHFQN